ncbi:MAG: VWA domain-containing protein [Desulfobacterales bacterium]|nr:VWA domain-containing protein [Desulfobacterales bacterium]
MERTDKFYRPETGLIENISCFSGLLRDNGVSVSLPGVLDAVAGLPLIDIFSMQDFRNLLRLTLVSRREDIARFHQLFYAYWLPNDPNLLPPPLEDPAGDEEDQRAAVPGLMEIITDSDKAGGDKTETSRDWALRYSPDSITREEEINVLQFASSKALYDSIYQLLQPLANRMSRRFQYSVRGKDIFLRRLLRKNMQFGGELILLDYKKKKQKKRRLIFFCDVSGSMDIYNLMILQFVHALKRIDRRTEIFFFSTSLSDRMNLFKMDDFDFFLAHLPAFITDWGGGTRLGHCLKQFNERYGRQLLSSKAIVMIFSDGWDRGEIDLLESQMAFLKKKSHKIIWLNPLLGTKGYRPLCQGMSTALPYVDYFLPIRTLQDLHGLSRTLKQTL